jgi:hypothetical protein
MDTLKELADIATSVRSELDKAFRFRYSDSEVNAQVYDAEVMKCMDVLVSVQKLRGASEKEVKREIEHLSRPGTGTCAYTGDLLPDCDYMVFVRGISEATPVVLGEEIAHGEHETEHVRRIGSRKGYFEEFGTAAPEFIGYLGMHCMAKKVLPAGKHITLDMHKADLAHKAGYTYASRLVNSGKEIPYADIFHAKDRKEMWDIMKDVTGP